MSDRRLRELERRAAQGDLEAEGQLLNERVRAGELTRDQVELLAYLQYPGAWSALGWRVIGYSGDPSESCYSAIFGTPKGQHEIRLRPRDWGLGLERWGREASLRAGSAAARHMHTEWIERFVAANCSRKASYVLGEWSPEEIDSMQDAVRDCLIAAEWCVLVDSVASQTAAGAKLNQARNLWNVNHLSEEGAAELPQFAMCFAQFAYSKNQGWLGETLAGSLRRQDLAEIQPCRHCGEERDLHHGDVGGNPDYPHDGLSDHVWEPLKDDGCFSRMVKRVEGDMRRVVRDELADWILEGRDLIQERLNSGLGPLQYALLRNYDLGR